MLRETARAKQAWADYLSLGNERSFEKLAALYRSRPEAGPTRFVSTLKTWSFTFGWQARLAAIAEAEAKAAEERERAYRRSILEDGYGLSWERVKTLKDLASALLADLTTGGKRWVRDWKQIGSGESAQPIEIERFNGAEVEQLRGVLDDIAKEKQERKEVKILAGDANNPLAVTIREMVVERPSGRGEAPPDLAPEEPVADRG